MLDRKTIGKLSKYMGVFKAQELILINNLKNINCFSYTKEDLIILLSFYNVTFFLCLFFLNGDPQYSSMMGFSGTLIVLFFLTAVDLIDKKNNEEIKIQEEQENTIRKIKEEYKRIHHLKRKEELLMKIEVLSQDMKKNIIFDLDTPPEEATKIENSHKKINFGFLNKPYSRNLPKNKQTS